MAAFDRCSGCGLAVAAGTVGCQALFEELVGRDFSDIRYGRFHGMPVDTYCLQHPERYCVSGKSLAAHLCGLCGRLEEGESWGEHNETLRLWLDGPRQLDKPPLPAFRGAVTIGDVLAAPDIDAHLLALERWARTTWDAYASLHEIARAWLSEARAFRPPRRRH